MNRKAIYSPTLVILVVFLLAYTIITFLRDDLSFYAVAGKNQVKLIELYGKGEFLRQYIKQSARNSINNGLFEFGQNGALAKQECKSGNSFLWNNNCKPNKENFIFYFDKNLKSYLSLNKEIQNLKFKHEIKDNNLIANAQESLLFNLDNNKIEKKEINKITGKAPIDIKEEAIVKGTYERDVSFKEKINFDFSVLDKLYEEIKNSKDCLIKGDITSNLAECIKDKKGFEWKANKESNFINFEIKTNYKILRNKNNQLIQENLVIKFKADMENM